MSYRQLQLGRVFTSDNRQWAEVKGLLLHPGVYGMVELQQAILIVAAPELLAACESTLVAFQNENPEARQAAIEDLKRAFAKANGA